MHDTTSAFIDRLDGLDSVHIDKERDVREIMNSITVDFTIGNVDEYRLWLDDDEQEYRGIHKGSVAIGRPIDTAVTELRLHLPPFQNGAEDVVRDALDAGDEFSMYFSSGGFTTAMPYPLPHVTLEHCPDDGVTLNRTLSLVKRAVSCYHEHHDLLLAERDDAHTGLDAGAKRREYNQNH